MDNDAPKLINEYEMARWLGVSVFTLRNDRQRQRNIPFVRLGGRCLYDPQRVYEVLRHYEVGGPRSDEG